MTERLKRAASNVQILQKARDYITPRDRWIQNMLFSGRGSQPNVCSIGAVLHVNGLGLHHNTDHLPTEVDNALKALAERVAVLQSRLAPNSKEGEQILIARFNDDPDTSHTDVLAAFDLAIEAECKIVREEAAQGNLELDKDQA